MDYFAIPCGVCGGGEGRVHFPHEMTLGCFIGQMSMGNIYPDKNKQIVA